MEHSPCFLLFILHNPCDTSLLYSSKMSLERTRNLMVMESGSHQAVSNHRAQCLNSILCQTLSQPLTIVTDPSFNHNFLSNLEGKEESIFYPSTLCN